MRDEQEELLEKHAAGRFSKRLEGSESEVALKAYATLLNDYTRVSRELADARKKAAEWERLFERMVELRKEDRRG